MRVTLSDIRKSFGAVEVVKGLDLRDRGRRVPGAARALRLRQDHGAAHGRGLEFGHLGPHPDRRARRHPRAAEIPRRGDGLPVLRALPAHDGRREHRLSAEAARRAAGRARCRRARGRGQGPSRRLPRPLPAPALRRPAPARRPGPRDGAPAERVPDGRAAVQPRRQAARPHALGAQAAAGRARRHHDLRHPRPDRGDDARPPRRDHEPRHRAADRQTTRRSTTIRPTSSSPASSARRR